MLRNIFILFSSTLFFFIVSVAHAQFSNAPDPLQFIVSPETPGPNQKVFIEVQGLGDFLGNSTIVWQENGKTVASGVGLTTFSFITGGVGTASRISVAIQTPSNGVMTHSFYFAPSVVYLTWEADTSVPLFYKGKSLYTSGSGLKVVAIPFILSGKTILPINRLSFQWKRGDTLVPEKSGAGKNTFTFSGDQLQSAENISLEVLYNNIAVGHAEVSIPAVDPQILMYDHDPLRGEILDRALPGSFTLTTNEISLQAEPYYFANNSVLTGKISYTWSLNNEDTVGPDSAKGLLTLRQTGQGGGNTLVAVEAQNLTATQFVQQAQRAINIVFGQSAGSSLSSFFGL